MALSRARGVRVPLRRMHGAAQPRGSRPRTEAPRGDDLQHRGARVAAARRIRSRRWRRPSASTRRTSWASTRPTAAPGRRASAITSSSSPDHRHERGVRAELYAFSAGTSAMPCSRAADLWPPTCTACPAPASRARFSRPSCASTAARSSSTSRTPPRGHRSTSARAAADEVPQLVHVRASAYPYILVGDLNAPPDAHEMAEFLDQDAAVRRRSKTPTHRMMEQRLDYILGDPGWTVRSARVLDDGPSDHRPVLAEFIHQ